LKFAENKDDWDGKEKYAVVESFIEKTMVSYFANLGYDPFGEVDI